MCVFEFVGKFLLYLKKTLAWFLNVMIVGYTISFMCVNVCCIVYACDNHCGCHYVCKIVCQNCVSLCLCMFSFYSVSHCSYKKRSIFQFSKSWLIMTVLTCLSVNVCKCASKYVYSLFKCFFSFQRYVYFFLDFFWNYRHNICILNN